MVWLVVSCVSLGESAGFCNSGFVPLYIFHSTRGMRQEFIIGVNGFPGTEKRIRHLAMPDPLLVPVCLFKLNLNLFCCFQFLSAGVGGFGLVLCFWAVARKGGIRMLDENTRNWILQYAIMKVTDGIDPDIEMSDEERESYERNVDSLREYMEMVGPEVFSQTSFDVGYDYD